MSGEMSAQASAGGVADPQVLNRARIMQSVLFEIMPCLGVAMELLMIEGGRLLEHNSRIGCSSVVLLEVSEALAERQRGGSLGVEDRGRRTRSRDRQAARPSSVAANNRAAAGAL